MLKLHQYQENAIQFAMDKGKSFQMLDMGLGKTAIALTVAARMKIPTLVFAPLRPALLTWPEEIDKWTPGLTYTVLHGNKKEKRLKSTAHIYIVPYSSLKWFHSACNNGRFRLRKFFTIFDESSMFKDSSTQRWKMMKSMQTIFSSYYRMNLSATPASSGLHDLWAQYYMLDGGERLGDRYYKFRDRLFTYTGPPKYQTIPFGDTNKFIYKKVKDITYRLKATDYLDMPEITYNNIPVKMTADLRRMYVRLKNDFEIKVNGNEIVANSENTVKNKLRQMLQGAMYTNYPKFTEIHNHKIQVLKELVDTHEGKSVLVPIQYKFEKVMIDKYFGRHIPVIDGDTPHTLSLTYIEKWNKGQIPLLLCHPESIGHGLNLQTGGNIVAWMALPWSLDHYHQLNGRLWRQGQKNGVIIHHILFKGSIDMAVASVLQRKDATQSDLLEALKSEGGRVTQMKEEEEWLD